MGIAVISLIIGLASVDLLLKYLVETSMKEAEEHELVNGKLKLRKVHNEGLAFNGMEEKPKLVKAINGAAFLATALYACFLFRRDGRKMEKAGLVLVLGGAISNLYDRFARNYVVDYVGFSSRFKRLRELTFNMADFFIFAGSFLMIIAEVVGKLRKRGR